jgi:group I intron endonuclease
MIDETPKQDNLIYYLYRITNTTNGKVYIGQSIDTNSRWRSHRREASKDNPTSMISKAIKKYGNDSFEFEVIASCKTWKDANDTETLLVKQYNSLVPNGYNVALGGYNAPKSEEWKKALSSWHASLSPEEKAQRSNVLREATLKQIVDKGPPGLGSKRTSEQRAKMSIAQQNRNLEYTPEVRKRMSDAHKGKKQPEELVKKRAATIRANKGDMICAISGCGEIKDRRHAPIINGIRYCGKHAWHAKKVPN